MSRDYRIMSEICQNYVVRNFSDDMTCLIVYRQQGRNNFQNWHPTILLKNNCYLDKQYLNMLC